MVSWQLIPIKLELKYTWKISRNSSTYKPNYVVRCTFNKWQGLGEIAPNVRYLETPDVIEAEFEKFIQAGGQNVHDLNELLELMNQLQLKNALKFGLESAYIHMLCHAEKTSIFDFLAIAPCYQKSTSYTIPILEPAEIAPFFEQNNLQRFHTIKLKTNNHNALETLNAFYSVSNQPVIVDPNEAFTNAHELILFMEEAKKYPVLLLEQPMPAKCVDDYKEVKKQQLIPLMADESVCNELDIEEIATQFDVVNMKLMKAGGYLNGLHILQQAKKHGLKTMIGCMVESSLGILSALNLCSLADYADLDGFLIVKNEPYLLLNEENGLIKNAQLQ